MLEGSVKSLVCQSDVLAGNPWGDPTRREVPVYVPPDFEPGEDLPLIAVLAGFTGVGAGQLKGTPWEPSFPERYERLLAAGEAERAAFFFPDCFTRLGGSQYMNSSATGRYEDHLFDELFPLVEREFGVGGRRERRGAMGKSSGGFGAIHGAFARPDFYAGAASHSGDAYFELAYKPDFPKLLRQLERFGGVAGLLAAVDRAPRMTTPLVIAMSMVAMAAAYSPDPKESHGIALPVAMRTGRVREDVWARWLEHDPVELARERGRDLADFALIYVDCGTKDEFNLEFGARQLVEAFGEHGVRVHHEEFDDGHFGINYRYERSLTLMTRALSA